jgi:hypothetical protein
VGRARDLAGGGADEAAWQVLHAAVPAWHAFRRDQVAPTPLIADPLLRSVLTRERSIAVISAPRGGLDA